MSLNLWGLITLVKENNYKIYYEGGISSSLDGTDLTIEDIAKYITEKKVVIFKPNNKQNRFIINFGKVVNVELIKDGVK